MIACVHSQNIQQVLAGRELASLEDCLEICSRGVSCQKLVPLSGVHCKSIFCRRFSSLTQECTTRAVIGEEEKKKRREVEEKQRRAHASAVEKGLKNPGQVR